MERCKGMRSGKIILYAAGGIYLSAVLSTNYFIPVFSESEIHPSSFINYMLKISKWIGGYGIVWSILAIALSYLLYRTGKHRRERCGNLQKGLILISIIFGFSNVAGQCMHYMDCLPISVSQGWVLFTCGLALGWAIIFYVAAYWGIYFLRDKVKGKNSKCGKIFEFIDLHLFLCSTLFIFVCWIPWIITYYPASMDNDVFFQLATVIGYRPPSNHHPWFSSCIIAFFYKIGLALRNENFGIFLYILFRDVIVVMIYARCVTLLKELGIKRWFYIGVVFFYGITPVWGAYAKHAFKDTFGAALFTFYIISLIVLVKKVQWNQTNVRFFVINGLAGVFAALFRNNIIYCIGPITMVLVFWLLRQKVFWYKISIIILCVLLYFLYNNYILELCGVEKGKINEALSIPVQQIARVVKYHDNELTLFEKQEIDQYFDYNTMAEKYNPILSDPIKDNADFSPGLVNFLGMWGKLYFKYPVTYLEAACGQSYGYYAFTPKREHWEGNWNSNMTIFNWIFADPDYFEKFSFHYVDSLEIPRQILHKGADIWDQIPILNLTDTIALYTWMIVVIAYYLFKERQFADMIPVFAICIVILTCIASPVNDCFRYYAPVASAFPALFALVGEKEMALGEAS